MDSIASQLMRGLVGYWPLATKSAVDLQAALYGTNVPAVLVNTNIATRADGPLNSNGAAAFASASTQSLSVVDSALLSLAGTDFTLATWAYLTDKAARRFLIGKWSGTGTNREFFIEVDNTADRVRANISADGSATVSLDCDTFGSPPTTTWFYVAARHSTGRNLNIWVNGFQNTAAHTTGANNGNGGLFIGGSSEVALYNNGRQSHAGLWNRCLSDQELFWLYNNGQGRDLTHG